MAARTINKGLGKGMRVYFSLLKGTDFKHSLPLQYSTTATYNIH